MAIWNFFRKTNTAPEVKNPDYPLTKVKQNAKKNTYDEYMQDLEDYRYLQDSDAVIDKLSRIDSDMSNAVHNFLIAMDSGIKYYAVDERGVKLSRATLRLDNIISRLKGKVIDESIETKIRQIGRLSLCRGGSGIEITTDSRGKFNGLYVIDPKWVDWYKEGDEYVAYQGNHRVSSDFLHWCFVDPDLDNPNAISPLLSSLQTIFFRIGVLNDLEKVINRTGWRKLQAKLVEEIMVRNAPSSVRRNAESLRKYLENRRLEIQSVLTNLKPEDALVHWDSTEVKYMDNSINGTLDVEPLMAVLDQQISSGLKTLPSILGRGTQANDMESVLYVRGIKHFQKIIATTLSNVLTYALELEGINAYAKIEFNEIDLRSPNEIENHKLMKQKRLLELAVIGFASLDEVCLELTGHELPKGFTDEWFELYRLNHLGVSMGTTDDDDSDNGEYNQQAEEQKPGEDSIDTRTDDEKEDNIIKNQIRSIK